MKVALFVTLAALSMASTSCYDPTEACIAEGFLYGIQRTPATASGCYTDLKPVPMNVINLFTAVEKLIGGD